MKKIFIITITVLMLGYTGFAEAKSIGRGYSSADFRTLTQTFFSMYNNGNPPDAMVDEYAQMAYCELYEELFTNDFEWNKVRKVIKNDLRQYGQNIPNDYEIVGDVSLARYDFEAESFPLLGKARHENVGKLYLFSQGDYFTFCGRRGNLNVLPSSYMVTLFNPFTITSLKISPEMAREYVDYMYQDKEGAKRVFARYRVRLYDLNDVIEGRSVAADFQGEIVSIDYFLDPELTQKLYTINYLNEDQDVPLE